ncbi:PLP-dependent aminotransferase family protein [Candidatus Viridilinea mediisalina]|uniref:Aminotransferase class I/II n=1 Tax=Candidatus Viridilinea mediisalina TaxID=2024553 RepID=A0A2A6RND8_9CHLR|nr:PLP-dependent aminotransferase family protein [Candidatus Viridilinea mediisalina]PDW04453.1 aminotransferase class I/II [Candidatus Viridilinea mediisalina]
MSNTLPDIQLVVRPGIVELGWGHPDPALLPADGLAAAAALTFAAHGHSALAYGAEQGPGRLLTALSERLGRLEGVTPPTEQLMITGGTSQALNLLCGQLSRPGDVVLVEAPTYHLALRIFADHGLRVVAVPGDAQGMHVETARTLLQILRSRGERVAFLYIVSNFGNPTGASLAPDRRYALATMARHEALMVLEDDAYGELWYDAPPAPTIYNLMPAGPIVRLGSFAKVLAPGLRLGWMLADPALVQRCVRSGMLDSGGCVNQFTAHMVASFIAQGQLDQHITNVRNHWRERRDAILAVLARQLPAGCTWNPILGGFFVWVRLPPHLDTQALLPRAEAAGVSYLPGARFFAEGSGQHYLRLSFSLLPPQALELGVKRLGAVLRKAC